MLSNYRGEFKKMVNVAIFASGGGSNAQKIIAHFAEGRIADIRLLISNKPEAGALKHASNASIETLVYQNAIWKSQPQVILDDLLLRDIDLIILAGFLLKIPDKMISAYSQRILNIHPALLPRFGGKGMYGLNVHRAVIESRQPISGITIHEVNEHYDEGKILFQASAEVSPNDTPESLEAKILSLEHLHFASQIERFIRSKNWK